MKYPKIIRDAVTWYEINFMPNLKANEDKGLEFRSLQQDNNDYNRVAYVLIVDTDLTSLSNDILLPLLYSMKNKLELALYLWGRNASDESNQASNNIKTEIDNFYSKIKELKVAHPKMGIELYDLRIKIKDPESDKIFQNFF